MLRVCASVCCADHSVINIPCRSCQGRTRRVNSGHMYIIYDSRVVCIQKKKKRKKGLARESFVQEQGKGYTVILYQCVNSVSIERVEEETRASPRGWNETVSSNRVRSEKLSSDSFRVSKMNYGQWRNL